MVGAFIACGRTQAPSSAPPVVAVDTAARGPNALDGSVSLVSALDAAVDAPTDALALPEEPWYHDNPEHTEDCVPALSAPPRPHFPAPFEACDPRAESYSSPPGGGGLHFHYRFFSVAATTAQRAQHPKTCCYLVWEFPRRRAPG